MTIGQLFECVLGKVACLGGYEGDATPFGSMSVSDVAKLLHASGYQRTGNETMYSGFTGVAAADRPRRTRSPICALCLFRSFLFLFIIYYYWYLCFNFATGPTAPTWVVMPPSISFLHLLVPCFPSCSPTPAITCLHVFQLSAHLGHLGRLSKCLPKGRLPLPQAS